MNTKFAILLAFAEGLCLATAALAADGAQPKYPPYPGVWGRELPMPETHRVYFPELQLLENGDVAILYFHRGFDPQTGKRAPSEERELTRLDFFSGHYRSIEISEKDRLTNRPGGVTERYVTPFRPFRLTAWRILSTGIFDRHEYGCMGWLTSFWNVVDHKFRSVDRRMLLTILDPPERSPAFRCGDKPDETDYIRRFDEVSPHILPLRDGTFLVTDMLFGMVLRFRPDLSSPFMDTHPNLFWVNADLIDQIALDAYWSARRSGGYGLQAIQDAVAEYLEKLKRAKEQTR